MKTLLKNGTVVNADGSRIADVLICNDKIKLIGENIRSDDAAVVDCSGKLLFPGFIDAHTHFDLPPPPRPTTFTPAAGLRSAAARRS